MGELFPLPNLNSKILRSNINFAPEYLYFPFFKGGYSLIEYLQNKGMEGFTGEECDVLIIIFHLYLTEKKEDGLLYFNTDDVLILRGVRKNKALKNGMSGYKREVRKRIDTKIKSLAKRGIFTVVDYKDFNFVLCMDEEIKDDIRESIFINRKITALNPLTKSWHKTIGIFLTTLKYRQKTGCVNIQIKKILNLVNFTTLFPFQIRNRLEDALDELSFIGVIRGWQYKNIDENEMTSKNWLFFWQQLSLKIKF